MTKCYASFRHYNLYTSTWLKISRKLPYNAVNFYALEIASSFHSLKQSAGFLRNFGFPLPATAAFPILLLLFLNWNLPFEIVHHVEIRWMNSAESCALGKYFRITALVNKSKIARAMGTLCLQFTGCSIVVVSLGEARRFALFSMSLSLTLCSKLQDIPPIAIFNSCSMSSQMKGGNSSCRHASKLFLRFLSRCTVS